MAIESVNPTTGERVASFRAMTGEQVDEVLGLAHRAQREWAMVPIAERARPMRKAAELLKAREADLARLMAVEMGKPLKDGVAEVRKCAWVCEHYADHAAEYLAPRAIDTDAQRSGVRFDPLGVVLAVMPWNFPFWQVFRFVAPGLMAGNGGVLKHASNVPQCALAIEQVARDAGFPANLFRTLLLESGDVEAVIRDDRIAAVTLTGSEGAGRAVARIAGQVLKPAVLELGGSDPFIVLADADLEKAISVAATARTLNAGQSCICAKRFIVERPVYPRFVQGLAAAFQRLKLGDPFAPETDLGPQARVDLRDELHAQVTQAIAEGARLLVGGVVPPGPGAFYPPTVLELASSDNIAFREELFGPVAPVLPVADAEEAVRVANASRFGLGASLWTQDREKAERLVPRIEAGAVFVNGLVKSDPRLPFGGIKASGFGRELGQEGIRAFTNVKTFWIG